MARLNLNCACGWNFFLPGSTTGHEVSCPNCGQAVPIPGRVPGQDVPKSAGAIAAEHQRLQNIIRLSIGAAIVVILAGIVYALIPGSPPPEVKPERRAPAVIRDLPVVQMPKPPVVNHPPEAPPPPLFTDAQLEGFRTTANEKVRLINLTTIVAEIVRHRDPQNEAYAKLQTDIAGHEAAVRECVANLAKVQQTVDLPSYCAKGDRIVGFNGTDFRGMYPGAIAQVLQNWVLAWRPGDGSMHIVNLERQGKELPIAFTLVEESPDLRSLLRHPVLKAEVAADGGASDRAALPADLLQQYQAGLQALPPGYLQVLPPAEGQRVARLLESKLATADEAGWFKSRVVGVLLPALEADCKVIRRKLADLEPLVKENPAPDAVILKGGQRIDCKVVPEGEDKVRLKTRGGSRVVPREEIERISPGKGIGTEVAARMEASKGNLEKLQSTLTWCTGKPLNNEKQYVACQILLLEPSYDAARSALGIGRPIFPGPNK